MPDWVKEFDSYYEVPGFISFLIGKEIVEDKSSSEEIAPSFGVYNELLDLDVRLYVDHPFSHQRRTNGAPRFQVIRTLKSKDKVFMTEDFDEALEKLFVELVRVHRPDGISDMSHDEWADPKEYLEELKKSYINDPYA